MISLIVATDENGIMAKQGKIPWHCKSDLKYFKETTTGKAVIMGRKTFETLKKPLPNRSNLVITRNPDLHFNKDVFICHGIEEAVEYAAKYHDGDRSEIFVIGGSSIYTDFLERDLIDKVYLNIIKAEVEPDETCLFFHRPSVEKYETKDLRIYDEFTAHIMERRDGRTDSEKSIIQQIQTEKAI